MMWKQPLQVAAMFFGAVVASNAESVVTALQTLTTNPAGDWSFGTYGTNLNTATFTKYTTFDPHYFNAGSSTPSWYDSEKLPTAIANDTGSTATFGTITNWPTNVLLLHPGSAGQESVARFTAPSAGIYSVQGLFYGLDPHPTSSDVHILLGGVGSLLSALVNSYEQPGSPSYNGTVSLTAGQTVDFVVGYGNNNDYSFDSTALAADITPTPEPATFLLVSGAFAAFVALKRRTA